MLLVAIPLAFALGVWATWRYGLSRGLAELQRTCHHMWGDTIEVAKHPYGLGPRFFKQWCRRCGHQRSVNEDGTPYVPKRHD